MNLMNQDNPVHIFFNTVGDVILANLLFLLCCIPVITIGPALTALYHCMFRIVKGNLNGICRTYFRAFWQNFRQSLAAWAIFLATAGLLFLNIRFLQESKSAAGTVMIFLCGPATAALVIYFLYVFPVIAVFSNRLGALIKNAYAFAFLHFPTTLLIAAVTFVPMFMAYQDLRLLPLYACCWFFFGFALTALVDAVLLYRIFRAYL